MGPDGNDNGTGRPARSGRPTRSAGQPFWARLWRLPLARASALAGLALGVLLALLASWAASSAAGAVTELERAEYARIADQVRGRLDRLVQQDEQRLVQVAFNDDLYAAVGRLLARPDTAWRPSFLENFVRREGDQFVGIYDLKGAALYRWTDTGSIGLDGAVVSNAVFRILDNREPSAGLVRRGDELFWLAGAPILPTDTADASQPIRGYLVTGRVFRPAGLAPAPGDRQIELHLAALAPSRDPVRPTVRPAAGGNVRVEFALRDIFAQQTTKVEATVARGAFASAEAGFRRLLAMTLLGIAVLVGAAWWLVLRRLIGPVERFAQALAPVHQGNTPALVGPVSAAAEWQVAVGAVNRLLAHVRTAQERADRALSAVRDGAWEQDLVSGEWSLTSRCRALLGHSDGAALPAAGLTDALHPDDRPAVLERLQAASGDGRAFSTDARLRRQDGTYAWFRIAATVQTDAGGVPLRFVGRLVSLDEEHAAREEAARLEQARTEARASYGRFLSALAREAGDAPWRADLELVASGFAHRAPPADDPFDLHHLLQEIANEAPTSAEVIVVPGVPTRVHGDRTLIRQVLERLARLPFPHGPRRHLTLRAEGPEAGDGKRIALVVEHSGTDLSSAERDRIAGILDRGLDRADGGPADLDLLVAHHALTGLGATAEVGGGPGEVRFRTMLTLRQAKEEYAGTAQPDFGQEVAGPWSDTPHWSAELPAAPQQEPAPSEPRVELVADATVTLNLDDPAPRPAEQPVARSFLEQLSPGGAGSGLAFQMATVFVKDAPVRLREMVGAAALGERGTVVAMAQSLGAMAGLVGAEPVSRACAGIETAALGEPETLEDLVRRVETALGEAIAALRTRLPAEPVGPEPEQPAIEPATLQQLQASFSADGSGLGNQLVTLFLAEAPLRLAAMERAAAGGDLAGVRASATELRGMGALVGARPLGDLALALDQAAPQELAPRVAAIRAELGRAQRILEELLHSRVNA